MGSELTLKKTALWTAGAVAVVLLVTLILPRLMMPGTTYKSFEGHPFPDISVVDAQQNNVALRDLFRSEGPQKTILALWATWCEPCLKELPVLARLQGKFLEKGYRLVLINYDGGVPDKTIPEVSAWLLAQKLDLHTFYDFQSSLLDGLGITSLPFAMRVGETGNVEWMKEGLLDWEKFELP